MDGKTPDQKLEGTPTTDVATTALSELKAQVEQLQNELKDTRGRLDKASETLLDANYLEFVANKDKSKAVEPARPFQQSTLQRLQGMTEEQMEALPLAQKIEIVGAYVIEQISPRTKELSDKLNVTAGQVEELKALYEIKDTAANHSDFWEHATEEHKRINAKPSLSVEEAYTQVKGAKAIEAEKEAASAEKSRSEKPGSTGGKRSPETPKEYKANEGAKASEDAWSQVMGEAKTL